MTETQLENSHSANGPADCFARRRNRDPKKAVLSSRVRLFKDCLEVTMSRYSLIPTVLCVILCTSGSAQDAPSERPDPDLEQAMAYTFADVVVFALKNESLGLIDAQKARIQQIYDIYYAESNTFLNKTLGIEPGTDTLDIFGKQQNSERQTPEDIAFLNEMDKTFEKQLRAELIPDQIEMAEKRVLQRRFERAGLRAIVSSTDIEIVKDLDLSRSLSDIRNMLKESAKETNKELQELNEEANKIIEDLRRKAEDIVKKQEEAFIKDLGNDGAKLMELIEEIK